MKAARVWYLILVKFMKWTAIILLWMVVFPPFCTGVGSYSNKYYLEDVNLYVTIDKSKFGIVTLYFSSTPESKGNDYISSSSVYSSPYYMANFYIELDNPDTIYFSDYGKFITKSTSKYKIEVGPYESSGKDYLYFGYSTPTYLEAVCKRGGKWENSPAILLKRSDWIWPWTPWYQLIKMKLFA